KRTHKRVDFLLQRTGQKSEPLACFNGWTSENDAIDLLCEQGADCHRDGNIGLTCSAGPNSKHHVVFFNLFHVTPLTGVLRCDRFFAEDAGPPMLEDSARRFLWLICRYANEALHFFAGKTPTAARCVVVLLDDLRRLLDGVVFAFDGEARVAQMSTHVEGIF